MPQKTLQRYSFLSGREKQTQEKMPLPTEKDKNHPKTPLSQTPRFNHTLHRWHYNHSPFPHPLPSVFHFRHNPYSTPISTLIPLPPLPSLHSPKIDVVDIGKSTSTTSVNRRRRRRFRGCWTKGKEDMPLPHLHLRRCHNYPNGSSVITTTTFY